MSDYCVVDFPELERGWEYTTKGEEHNKSGSNSQHKLVFTLASYNVLAQDLLENNSWLYKHCPQYCLSWDYRWNNLLAEITHRKPDVSVVFTRIHLTIVNMGKNANCKVNRLKKVVFMLPLFKDYIISSYMICGEICFFVICEAVVFLIMQEKAVGCVRSYIY